ncbi:hypothetical protein NGRA_3162 [Nosema granulosis]|uniref:Uncharacterized protein n=1 Tax=Nosema granulosis TaxID=83296 RepID=A0A9P6KX09_9MICR|nr:hypothetical protein NGRA_3162 [Nosema granulosis]
MNWILLLVLDIVICPRTSLTSSYIINTSDSGSEVGLNVPELRNHVDESLYFIPQNQPNSSPYYQETEADINDILDLLEFDDHHQIYNKKKDPEFSNLKKRKLTDEIITSPEYDIKKTKKCKNHPESLKPICKIVNYTKTLTDNSFLMMIKNYNLPILSYKINIDLLRLSRTVNEIPNTTNIQTDDNSIYEEVFKRIVDTVNLLFLSKVNEKNQNSQNVIVSEPKTPFDIFDDDIYFLRKEILKLKQDENIITSGKIAMLESKLKHSLVEPRNHFCVNLKKVAHLIYNNNNFDVTIIIKNLLYEMRILKYEVREMRSVILTIIYYNNFYIEDARVFLDLFICRMFVLFKTINSIDKTESPIKYLEKTSYFIHKIFYNFFYGDTERHFMRFHKKELYIKNAIDGIIGENNYDLPFSTADLLIFRVLGFRSSFETHNTIINIVKLINNPENQPRFILSNCYNFLLKLRTIGEILIPINQDFTDLEEMKTRN